MSTQLLDTEIVYDRTTKDYAITVCGIIVGFGRTYSEAEAIRTQVLAERQQDGYYHTATLLDGDALDKDGEPAGVDQTDPSAPPDPDPAPGREIARAFHRDYRGFARRQLLKPEHELRRDAVAYAAYMSERLPKQPPLTPEHVLLIWRMAARYAIEAGPAHPLLVRADASAESYAGL